MARRLHAAGITTVQQLCSQSQAQLQRLWGSGVLGTIWWSQLRGMDLPARPTRRRTVGHSHVLAPAYRTHERAMGVMIHLVHKAGRRLRRLGYCANRMTLSIRLAGGGRWRGERRLAAISDTLNLVRHAAALWPGSSPGTPIQVAIVLSDLEKRQWAQPMFKQQRRDNRLAHVMDRIHWRYGSGALVCAAMLNTRDSAPTRISFTQIPDMAQDFD